MLRKLTIVQSILFILVYPVFSQQLWKSEKECSILKQSSRKAERKILRSAAQENYDVKFYFLDIDAGVESAYISAKVSMKAQVVSDQLSEIEIGLSNKLQVDSVFIDEEKVSFAHSDDVVSFVSPSILQKGALFTTTVYYQGNGQSDSFFSGITNAEAFPGMPVTYTLSEPESAIDWFACKQSLEDKADSAYIFITVPPGLMAGSNGLLENVTDLGKGKTRFEWKTRYPIAYYLISMTIADYFEYNTSAIVDSREVLIQNYLYNHPDVLKAVKANIDRTAPMMERMSELFGAYPFMEEKYGHAMAPLGGGMEHQTMSTMDGFEFTLVAHELAHQWFGNSVTCGTWQDIWINEGFARYCEYLMIESLISKVSADSWMEAIYADVIERKDGSVYVPAAFAQDDFRVFDGTLTYNKGSALLHMIRNIIDNDDVFFEVLRTFLQQHKDGNATGEDFRTVLQGISGMSFENFFDEWYYGEGHPLIKVRWNYDQDTLYVEQTQSRSHSSVDLFHVAVDYGIGYEDDSEEVVRLETTGKTQLFKIHTGKPVSTITVDPEGWLLKNLGSVARDRTLKSTLITAIEYDFHSNFNVYPNPATGTVWLHAETDGAYDVELLDIRGLVVESATRQRGDWRSRQHRPGVYLLRYYAREGSGVQRVVVK